MKNPTPLFAPVIAATLPEGAANAAAAAEDDMLGEKPCDLWLGCLDAGSVGEVSSHMWRGLAVDSELWKEEPTANLVTMFLKQSLLRMKSAPTGLAMLGDPNLESALLERLHQLSF